MSDLTPHPRDDINIHVHLPLYRADDGQFTKCWCGADCREDKLLRESNVVNIAFARSIRMFK